MRQNNLLHIITGLSLFIPLFIGVSIGKDFSGVDFPLFVGILLQAIVGNFILLYSRGYEDAPHLPKIFLGYFLFFAGLSGSYLSGKSSWLWFYWEVSTMGAIFLYTGQGFSEKAIRSIIALFLSSGTSMVLISVWVFLPEGNVGRTFLLFALLIKAAFSGLHIWLPEAHTGPPAHGSAAYSGLMVNLPLLLFVRYILPDWSDMPVSRYLTPAAGLGVFFGGLIAFFSKDAKRLLAYSTIENLNLMWLILFVSGVWMVDSSPDISFLGKSFMLLFYITLLHHSFSKIFQFLSIGYLCKKRGSTYIDDCKGMGRMCDNSSPFQMSLGSFSFSMIPGTSGFVSEATFFYLLGKVIDLPIGKSVFVLPAVVLLLIGLAMGSAAHVKLFLPTILSIPADEVRQHRFSFPKSILLSLQMLGFGIVSIPIIVLGVVALNPSIHSAIPPYFYQWLVSIVGVSFLSAVFGGILVYFRWSHKVKTKQLWDCGSGYAGDELSIPASVISDPLFPSTGKYFHDSSGNLIVDKVVVKTITFVLSLGDLWIKKVESGELSKYLFLSSASLLISLLLILGYKALV